MKIQIKIPAATLPTTLVVSILLLLAIMGVFLIWDNGNSEIYLSNYRMQKDLNLESAVIIYCNDSTISKNGSVQLYEDIKSSVVNIDAKPFGLYEIIRVESDSGRFSKSALVGKAKMSRYNSILYVSDNKRPLSLTGKTEITGEIRASSFGVTYNQIRDVFFSGEKIKNDSLKISENELPKTIDREFVIDDDFMIISEEMMLEDTVIIAKSITVKSGFTGTVQLVATDTIIIETNVKLKYPSGLYITSGNPDRYIEIAENSEVNGYVVIEKSNSQIQKLNYKQQSDAIVRGVVYINGIAQVHGIIIGELYANELNIYTPEGIYRNTIFNLEIMRSENMIAPIIIEDAPYERGVIKWLD